MERNQENGGARLVTYVSGLVGAVVCIWSTAAVVNGLAQVNWQVSELLRQYLIAIGVIQEFHTLVDFYTHIKGVEYIICLSFLCLFPVFYGYVNKPAREAEVS